MPNSPRQREKSQSIWLLPKAVAFLILAVAVLSPASVPNISPFPRLVEIVRGIGIFAFFLDGNYPFASTIALILAIGSGLLGATVMFFAMNRSVAAESMRRYPLSRRLAAAVLAPVMLLSHIAVGINSDNSGNSTALFYLVRGSRPAFGLYADAVFAFIFFSWLVVLLEFSNLVNGTMSHERIR